MEKRNIKTDVNMAIKPEYDKDKSRGCILKIQITSHGLLAPKPCTNYSYLVSWYKMEVEC